jgi:hypothetical protein
MVKMALVGWVNPAKIFRETSRTGRHHSHLTIFKRALDLHAGPNSRLFTSLTAPRFIIKKLRAPRQLNFHILRLF